MTNGRSNAGQRHHSGRQARWGGALSQTLIATSASSEVTAMTQIISEIAKAFSIAAVCSLFPLGVSIAAYLVFRGF